MTELRAVLFDLSGTVMMPLGAREWVARTAAQVGLSLSPGSLDDLAAAYLRAGLPGGPYPDDVPEAVARMYEVRDYGAQEHRAAYLGLLSTVPEPAPGFTERLYERVLEPSGWLAYSDAAPTVTALRGAGVRVGLISNIGYDARPLLAAHGLQALADHATLSCEHRIMKPDVRLFEIALDMLGATAQETLMVGDHAEADAGGVRLGMPTLILPMTPPGGVHGLGAVARIFGA